MTLRKFWERLPSRLHVSNQTQNLQTPKTPPFPKYQRRSGRKCCCFNQQHGKLQTSWKILKKNKRNWLELTFYLPRIPCFRTASNKNHNCDPLHLHHQQDYEQLPSLRPAPGVWKACWETTAACSHRFTWNQRDWDIKHVYLCHLHFLYTPAVTSVFTPRLFKHKPVLVETHVLN